MNSEFFFLMDPGYWNPKFNLELPIGICAQPCLKLKFNLEAFSELDLNEPDSWGDSEFMQKAVIYRTSSRSPCFF